MIDTVLFDLDGTLLRFTQKAFIDAYFGKLEKVFAKMGLDCALSVKSVWAGTKAMVLNDGSMLNKERFWRAFSAMMGLDKQQEKAVEAACDSFYSNEFNSVSHIVDHSGVSARLVRGMVKKGYSLVLATNPMFPECAVSSRLGWIGLDPSEFILVTHYANSSYCKPNPGYYSEIFAKIGKKPQQCIMVGNSPTEDMAAQSLGAAVFLVTDYIEGDCFGETACFPQGTLADLEKTLMSMPDICPL